MKIKTPVPLPQCFDVSTLPMTKCEIIPNAYGAGMKSVRQKLPDECIWRERCKLDIEANDKQQLNPVIANLMDLLFGSVDSFGRLVRREHLYWMRFESHHYGRKAHIARSLRNGFENRLMPQMKSVEISNAQNAGPACESVRCFGQ